MTKRLQEIYSLLPNCKVFADVGCDHGYIAKAMLDGDKCQKVIISDISDKCLQKAKDLLAKELQSGVAEAIVSDGFDNLPYHDLALIAGMGGEEIVAILKKAKNLPEKLLLQPMKNTDKVRVCAVELGYKIITDYTFYSSKIYYDVILLEKGEDSLSLEEIEFGRTNLQKRPQAFINCLQNKISVLQKVCKHKNLKKESLDSLTKEINRIKKYVDDK